MVHRDEHLTLTGIHHRVVLGREEGEEGRGRGGEGERRGGGGKEEERRRGTPFSTPISLDSKKKTYHGKRRGEREKGMNEKRVGFEERGERGKKIRPSTKENFQHAYHPVVYLR